MMDRLKLTGLTKTEAERCLDWLQNHGYTACRAELHHGLWTIAPGKGPTGQEVADPGLKGWRYPLAG